jgi:TPR repeat protein
VTKRAASLVAIVALSAGLAAASPVLAQDGRLASLVITKLLKEANDGSAQSQLTLAMAYSLGRLVDPDQGEAAKWCRKAADSGLAAAQTELGLWYEQGKGLPQSYAEAFAWYRKAADQGDAAATFNIGLMYGYGRGQLIDANEAARWYQLAAERGSVRAEAKLGAIYLAGLGVPKDPAKALAWRRKAAEHGEAFSQYELGYMLSRGIGAEKDLVQAYAWLTMAASKYALTDATGVEIARWRSRVRKDLKPEQAVAALKFAADKGDRFALLELANAYDLGEGVKKDPGLATELRRKAQKTPEKADDGSAPLS